ncbi:hypothetical protein QBC39DRAFT_87325 [Podospora conica]|nr:hypothetical protein QBC39DRAFT_87325 [Schizothecium conicum]
MTTRRPGVGTYKFFFTHDHDRRSRLRTMASGAPASCPTLDRQDTSTQGSTRWLYHANGMGRGNGFHRHGGRLADGMARSAWEGDGLRQWHGQGPTTFTGDSINRQSQRLAITAPTTPTRQPGISVDGSICTEEYDCHSPPLSSQYCIFLALGHVCILGDEYPPFFNIDFLERMRDHTHDLHHRPEKCNRRKTNRQVSNPRGTETGSANTRIRASHE